MSKIKRWHVGPAFLALALVACEDSITGIPEPVFEVAPAVEAVTPIVLAHGGCVAPGAGLVSWWTGDVDGDYSDFLGTNPIARYQGVLFQPGVVDGAFRFQGIAGHYMEIDDSSTLRPANFTVGLWAERRGEGQRATDVYGNMLVQKAISNPSSGGSLWSYFVSWRSDGTLAAGVYFDNDPGGIGGTVRIETNPAEPFPNDVPIFIALSVAGPDNALVVNLSVNGVVKGTFDATGLGAVSYGDGDMVIGNQYAELRRKGFHRTFDGIIDEVDIFDRALSIEDIQAMYAAGSAGRCKTPEPVNTAPVVDAFEGGWIDEGGTFETSVTFTDDDSGAWTASVDYGDGSGANPTVIGTGFDLSHAYAQDGTYTVTVTVTDDLGAEGSSSASVVVSNVVPTVDAGPDATIFEGATFESAGSFEDPGVEDVWSATVDYGDGSGVQPLALSGMNFELSHTYADHGSGPFTVTVMVHDDHNAGVGLALLAVEGGDEALVTVVYPLTIHEATVKLGKSGWWRRHSKDSYAVEGRLPLSLLERFDPDTEELTVEFAGVMQVIPAGSLVRKGHKLQFKASRHAAGVRKIDIHDDGRFKIQARGPFGSNLHYVDFREPVDFSLLLGPDIGEASIQLDGRLRFRSHYRDDDGDAHGDDDDDDDDDDDEDDDEDDDHRRKGLRRWFKRAR